VKAVEIQFLEFVRQADQLTIPIYQRQYSWTDREWEQLWNDIVLAAETDRAHFVGSVVYVYGDEGAIGQVTPAQVIDGQQRLTTITILLNALFRSIAAVPGREADAQRLRSRYLFNAEEEGDERYKLVLTRSDRDTLMRLLDGNHPREEASGRVLAADEYFRTRLARAGLDNDEVLKGLHHLMAVSVALDRVADNPQLVFDSLNSTGVDLAEGDRIRNFVLMDLPPAEQERLYTASWYPMEELFRGQEATTFDRFVRDYLTARTGQIPRIDRVYEAFKKYSAQSPLARFDLVGEMLRYARLWGRVALGREQNSTVAAALNDINQLRVDVAYPFLITLLGDCDEGKLAENELIGLLRLVETYVFRRAVCAIPTNTLNKTFAALPGEINQDDYAESAVAALLVKESYFRMPSDEEFRTQLCGRDVYSFRPRNYLLGKLENASRKEMVEVSEYTIEHVMPQNPDLSPEWQEELGVDWVTVQEKYLHTLGNLTLTGYNSELSDRPFADKQLMLGGFRDSPIRLNESIAQCERWNEAAIVERGRALADKGVHVWQLPDLSEAVLAKYRRSKTNALGAYSLDDHANLTGVVADLFNNFDRRVRDLDSGIVREIRKQYIAYKFAGNLVCVVPRQQDLLLYLAASVLQLDDPDGRVRDVHAVGHWGTGDSEIVLTSSADFDWTFALIQQVLDRQMESGGSLPSYSEAAVEQILELADPDMQQATRVLLDVALRYNLYPRPWKRAVMFTPPSNRLWALLTIQFTAKGETNLGVGADAFAKFYAVNNEDLASALDMGTTWQSVDADGVRRVAEALDALMLSVVSSGRGLDSVGSA
jgi:uncharacterized protein with ParB-like and HNH nuclease domain/predicted transport protein